MRAASTSAMVGARMLSRMLERSAGAHTSRHFSTTLLDSLCVEYMTRPSRTTLTMRARSCAVPLTRALCTQKLLQAGGMGGGGERGGVCARVCVCVCVCV